MARRLSMKIGEVSIPDAVEFSHELPEGTKILGVLNPLAHGIGVGLPEKKDSKIKTCRFMSCRTGDIVPDGAEYLGSIGHGTKHIFFLG